MSMLRNSMPRARKFVQLRHDVVAGDDSDLSLPARPKFPGNFANGSRRSRRRSRRRRLQSREYFAQRRLGRICFISGTKSFAYPAAGSRARCFCMIDIVTSAR